MPEKRKEPKSAQKTLRITMRTHFSTEACSQLLKKSETDFAEAAIQRQARLSFRLAGISFDDTFHRNVGVRWCRVYARKGFPLNDLHEARRAFVLQHKAFFFSRGKRGRLEVNVPNVETLCPGEDIEQLDEWIRLGRSNYWDSGREMVKALTTRGIAPPAWPPAKKAAP